MSSILPPEFFGIGGLAESVKQIAGTVKQKKDEERKRAFEQLQLAAQLNPNNRAALIAQAEALGLIDPGQVPYVPTAIEKIQSGIPYDQLTLEEQMLVAPDLGLRAGQTPALARRGEVAGVSKAEVDVQTAQAQLTEVQAAQRNRQQYESALNQPWFKEMIGVDPETQLTPGSIEAYKVGQGITLEGLNQALVRARTAGEYAQIALIRAQIRRQQAEMNALAAQGADDGTLDWLKKLSDNTGWSPMQIQRAIQDKNMVPEIRDQILQDVGTYQAGLRAAVQKSIRDGTAGVTMKALENMYTMAKNGMIPVEQNDPVWGQMMAQALTEDGFPSIYVPGVDKFGWWNDQEAQLITPFSQVQELFEGPGATEAQDSTPPAIDPTTAQRMASYTVQQQGGFEQARRFINDNPEIQGGNKRLILQALSELENAGADSVRTTEGPDFGTVSGGATTGTTAVAPTGAAPTAARPVAPTPTAAPVATPTQEARPLTWEQAQEQAREAEQKYRTRHPGRSLGLIARVDRVARMENEKATLQERADTIRARAGFVPPTLEDQIQKLEEKIQREKSEVSKRVAENR